LPEKQYMILFSSLAVQVFTIIPSRLLASDNSTIRHRVASLAVPEHYSMA
jgi:hypothetical protein